MSHLDEAKTTMTNKEGLIRALIALGFTRAQIEVHDKAKDIIGYHSTDDGKVGNVIIRKQHTRIPSDIGWEMKDGNYVGHIDNYDYNFGRPEGKPIYDRKWSVNLVRNYNIETTKMHFEAKGLTARVVTDAKGRVQIRAYSPVKAKQPLRVSI